MILSKIQRLHQLQQHLGYDWLLYRLRYAARLRTGLVRRQLPATAWEAQPLPAMLADPDLAGAEAYYAYRRRQAPPFFFSAATSESFTPFFARWDTATALTPLQQADELAGGTLRYFGQLPVSAGSPPAWHRNALSGQQTPDQTHWSQLNDFDYGDIKVIWEPSRFGFAFTLVRAYSRRPDNRYAELFWQWVEDWRQHNPPQHGLNWKCGQETSFRVMAWCFGLTGFMTAPATNARRVAMLAQMIAVSGQRIEANLGYALSQRNNHSISEAAGLWTIGLLFPELRAAGRWRERGRQVLEAEARDLIYDDGAFSQHSVNYQRLMLHDYLWAIRLGQVNQQPLSAELTGRVARAGQLLYQLQDESTSRLPTYGPNDGALILPLNNCDSRDYRPVIQAIHYLNSGQRCYPDGPWDEDLLWLFGPAAVAAPVASVPRPPLQAASGGYYTLRSDNGFAFMRCATFRHRPGHADMLHLDLWWRGQNIALDPGTYSYNAPAPWNNALAQTAYHNTVTVDGLDQMERAGKFLWLPWLKGTVNCLRFSPAGKLAYWEGEHNGYRRLNAPVSQRRGVVRLASDWWLVLDALHSAADHEYRLHWLLPDLPYNRVEAAGQITLQTGAGDYTVAVQSPATGLHCSLLRADETSPRGWFAPNYQQRQPALSFEAVIRAKSALFLTLFGPEAGTIDTDEKKIIISTPKWVGILHLNNPEASDSTLFSSINMSGTLTDKLELS